MFRRVPLPFVTAEEFLKFTAGDRTEINRAIYREAERLVEAMVEPLNGEESPQFVAMRERLLEILLPPPTCTGPAFTGNSQPDELNFFFGEH